MQTLTVLVLEDEPFQRLVTVTALEKLMLGTVLQAADGNEAVLTLAGCEHVDILLCDLKMAGMDGLAFLRHATSSGKVRAVVLCSGLDPVLRQATVLMIHCLGLTFLGDLGKPFNIEGFNQLVKRYKTHCNAAPRLLLPAEMPTLNDVLQGLDNGAFEAYYQPKINLQGQTLVGAEVLARWVHPQWGVLAPAHFLPVMEQHNLIDRMFWHLFEQGLALHRRLAAQGLTINLAFNLNPSQLACSALTERIPVMLKRAHVPATCVISRSPNRGCSVHRPVALRIWCVCAFSVAAWPWMILAPVTLHWIGSATCRSARSSWIGRLSTKCKTSPEVLRSSVAPWHWRRR